MTPELLAALLSLAASALAEPGAGPERLSGGEQRERRLAGGQTDVYVVAAGAHGFIDAAVDQDGVDVVVRLRGPDGALLVEADSPTGRRGTEHVAFVAVQEGDYRLEVACARAGTPEGTYRLSLGGLHGATADDVARAETEAGVAEANRLYGRRDGDSLRAAEHGYAAAAVRWKALGLPDREADALLGRAYCLRLLSETRAALDLFERVAAVRRQKGDRDGEATAVNQIGLAWSALGDPAAALTRHRQAAELWQKSGDALGEASALSNVALDLQSLGTPRLALEPYRQALARMEALGHQPGQARVLGNLGGVFDMLGETGPAREHYERALAVVRGLGDRRGQAEVLNNLGLLEFHLGAAQRALDLYRQALPLWRETGDRGGEAMTLGNQGFVYGSLGQPSRAADLHAEALAIQKATGDRRGQALSGIHLGRSRLLLGDGAGAVAALREALALWQAVGDSRGEAAAWGYLGEALAARGDSAAALSAHEKALALQRASEDGRGAAESLDRIGVLLRAAARPADAREKHLEARDLRVAAKDAAGEARTLHRLALVEADLGRLPEAQQLLEVAVERAESLRGSVGALGLRAGVLASRRGVYEASVDVLMRRHQAAPGDGFDVRALEVSERARSRALLDLLSWAGVELDQAADTRARDERRRLRQRLQVLSARLEDAAPRASVVANATAAELDAVVADLEQLEADMRRDDVRLRGLPVAAPFTLAGGPPRLDADTVLLEYLLGEERSYVWALSARGVESAVLPPRAEIERRARAFHAATAVRSEPDGACQAEAVSDLVLRPVRQRLGARRIVVVADGALQYVPFAALPLPGADEAPAALGAPCRAGTPLLAEHEVVSLPSIAVLDRLRLEGAAHRPAPRSWAIFADPVFDRGDPRVVAAAAAPAAPPEAEHEPVLPRLGATAREAAAIASLAPDGDGMEAVGFAATREAVLSPDLRKFRYLHFATHARVDAQRPELSGIVLSQVDEQGRPRNGVVRLGDLADLRLNADLAVLSACQTALGPEMRGEGLLSFTRGFMAAGVPRVVASLWQVPDRATAELMRQFYGGLVRDRLPAPEALRRAQLAVRGDRRWRHPYYWAGFVLSGEWR